MSLFIEEIRKITAERHRTSACAEEIDATAQTMLSMANNYIKDTAETGVTSVGTPISSCWLDRPLQHGDRLWVNLDGDHAIEKVETINSSAFDKVIEFLKRGGFRLGGASMDNESGISSSVMLCWGVK